MMKWMWCGGGRELRRRRKKEVQVEKHTYKIIKSLTEMIYFRHISFLRYGFLHCFFVGLVLLVWSVEVQKKVEVERY